MKILLEQLVEAAGFGDEAMVGLILDQITYLLLDPGLPLHTIKKVDTSRLKRYTNKMEKDAAPQTRGNS